MKGEEGVGMQMQMMMKVETYGRKQTRMRSKERKVTEGGWAR